MGPGWVLRGGVEVRVGGLDLSGLGGYLVKGGSKCGRYIPACGECRCPMNGGHVIFLIDAANYSARVVRGYLLKTWN